MARMHVPEADEGALAAVNQRALTPTLSRKRERGNGAAPTFGTYVELRLTEYRCAFASSPKEPRCLLPVAAGSCCSSPSHRLRKHQRIIDRRDARTDTTAGHPAAIPDSMLDGLQWRLVGPFRAGWGTMAAGIPEQPNTFYFGAAGGGVWKTDRRRRDVATDVRRPRIRAGRRDRDRAVAIRKRSTSAPASPTRATTSPPATACTNRPTAARTGSTRACRRRATSARSWSIRTIANTVLVAALGHIFGPNPDRGVFRTTDGGATWKKVAVRRQPDRRRRSRRRSRAIRTIVFAADVDRAQLAVAQLFHADRRRGQRDLQIDRRRRRRGNVCTAKTGRKASSAASASPPRISPAARRASTPTIDDDDARRPLPLRRRRRALASVNKASAVSTWYMSRPHRRSERSRHASTSIGPVDPQIDRRRQDASRSSRARPAATTTTTSGSTRALPSHMITASDQGTVVSVDGGAHWSDWYNQPTGQFYHLAADNRFPYWIYSGQQDSGTVGIASRSDYGAISFRDWHPVGGDERDYDMPDPDDREHRLRLRPRRSRISRWDARTGEVQNVSPWPIIELRPAADRRQIPLHLDHADRVLRARAVRALRGHAGAVPLDRQRPALGHRSAPTSPASRTTRSTATATCRSRTRRACGYGVIYSIAPSPRDNDEIWIGTDNGLIQRTARRRHDWQQRHAERHRRRGRRSPRSTSPRWSRHRLRRRRQPPRRTISARIAVRTHDYGKTWTQDHERTAGRPFRRRRPRRSGRDGPALRRHRRGVYVSFDDGDALAAAAAQPARRLGARPARPRQRPHRRDARPRDLGARRRVAAAAARREHRARRRAPVRARARDPRARQPEQGHAAARRHRARHESADRRDHRLHARANQRSRSSSRFARGRRRRRQAARRPPLRERRQDAADQGRTLLRRSVDETRRRNRQPNPARTASSGTCAGRGRRRSNTTIRSRPCGARTRR